MMIDAFHTAFHDADGRRTPRARVVVVVLVVLACVSPRAVAHRLDDDRRRRSTTTMTMTMTMTRRGADVGHRSRATRRRSRRARDAPAVVAQAQRERASPYDVLRVSPDATSTEIKVAFRALAKATHPDSLDARAADGVAFREVMSAYSVLSDEGLRAKIDDGVVLELEEFRWVDGRRRWTRDNAAAFDRRRDVDVDVEEAASSPWDANYDDSDEYVKWTKPKRAKVPNVEGLTPAPSDREARVMKWRIAQFARAWCVSVERRTRASSTLTFTRRSYH